MKKFNLVIFFCALVIGLTGCQDDEIFNAMEQAERDEATILAFIESEGYEDVAIKDEDSGIYYVIFEQGAGVKPTFGSTVITHYSGYFLSGVLFDSSLERGPLDFVMGRGDVIAGWDRGFALIEEGSRALLIIPSGMAYGNVGTQVIPPNSVLQFEVNLIDVR